jgi:hypothetical protein
MDFETVREFHWLTKAVISSRIEGIEKKIDDIADILEKVGD